MAEQDVSIYAVDEDGMPMWPDVETLSAMFTEDRYRTAATIHGVSYEEFCEQMSKLSD